MTTTLVVHVLPDDSDDVRKGKVLDVLGGHGCGLRDIGVRCEIEVREVSPDRRVHPSMKEIVARRAGKGSLRLRGVYRRR
jgi:hypothetical protein